MSDWLTWRPGGDGGFSLGNGPYNDMILLSSVLVAVPPVEFFLTFKLTIN